MLLGNILGNTGAWKVGIFRVVPGYPCLRRFSALTGFAAGFACAGRVGVAGVAGAVPFTRS